MDKSFKVEYKKTRFGVYMYMPKLSLKSIISHLELSVKQPRSHHIHELDEFFFDVIDTEEKAYWLGYLMADGCVSTANNRCWSINISLAKEDEYILHKLRKSLNPKETISLKLRAATSLTHQDQYRLTVYSNKLALALIRLNCIPKKSLVLEFPPHLRFDMLHHFIRGHFDGDGAFNLFKRNDRMGVKIVSSHSFIRSLQKNLNQVDIKSHIYTVNKGRNSSLLISDVDNLCRFVRFIYKDASIYLYRKRDKFLSWKHRAILKHDRSAISFDTSKNKNGRYRLRYSFNGTRHYLGMFESEAEMKKVIDKTTETFEGHRNDFQTRILDQLKHTNP